MKKGQESSVVGRLGKGYPQIPQFQISPNYKHHIENLPIYPFKEEILETIDKVDQPIEMHERDDLIQENNEVQSEIADEYSRNHQWFRGFC